MWGPRKWGSGPGPRGDFWEASTLPDPQEAPGQDMSHAHPLHPDVRWEEWGQPQPGPDGPHPPGAVSPRAMAGSGQGHGGGSGVCGPQRWHSPAPAQPGPLGLPGGSPLPRQAVAGGPGVAWAGNVNSKEGSGMHAQPLAARPGHARQREGSAGLLPNRGSALSLHGHSPPLPPRLPVPAIPGFALASSQTPECACWLRGSCSWNWGDKAPPVSESGRTGRARPAPRMNRAQSPGPRMNGLTDAQTPVNGPQASKDAVELGTGRGARRPGMQGANLSGSILVKSLVKGEQSPPTPRLTARGTRALGSGVQGPDTRASAGHSPSKVPGDSEVQGPRHRCLSPRV